jgi:hypothetical protein
MLYSSKRNSRPLQVISGGGISFVTVIVILKWGSQLAQCSQASPNGPELCMCLRVTLALLLARAVCEHTTVIKVARG